MKKLKSSTQRNLDVFAETHGDLVSNWYPKWTSEIRRLIPSDMAVSDSEIDSEITTQCLYLASLFKGGSFQAYCDRYVAKRSARTFWREYKMLDHELIADAYDEFDTNYSGSYEQKKQVVVGELEEARSLRKQIETEDLADVALRSAKTPDEKLVLELVMDDLTYEQIGEKLEMSKMQVSRVCRKIGEAVKNMNGGN